MLVRAENKYIEKHCPVAIYPSVNSPHQWPGISIRQVCAGYDQEMVTLTGVHYVVSYRHTDKKTVRGLTHTDTHIFQFNA